MHIQERKEQIRTLWQKCFNDSPEFVDFYFDRVYQDINALTLEYDGRVVSALQMIPYTMNWCDTEIRVAYISGACTDPAYRGKGLMRELLHQAFRQMRMRAFDITALIPADASLFEFYRAYQYTEVFDFSRHTYEKTISQAHNPDIEIHALSVVDALHWFAYFDQEQRRRPSAILHSQPDFQNNIIDNLLSQGVVLGAHNAAGQAVGIAFVTSRDGETHINEMFYADEAVKNEFLFSAAEAFATEKVYYKSPAQHPITQRHGMAMVVNKEKLIDQWLSVHPETPETVETLHALPLPALTQLLFDYEHRAAYMSLMMD